MSDVTEAHDRIRARVDARAEQARVAAAPVTVMDAPPDPAAQLADMEAAVTDLQARVTELEQAQLDDALGEMEGWAPDAMTAAAFDQAERDRMAKSGVAMPDGSFPIRNQADLENAVASLGRASNPDEVKAHIRTRAEALGLTGWLQEHAPSVVG